MFGNHFFTKTNFKLHCISLIFNQKAYSNLLQYKDLYILLPILATFQDMFDQLFLINYN